MSSKRKLDTVVKSKSITSFFKPVEGPASKKRAGSIASTCKAVIPKFDKTKWIEGLTSEQRQLLDLEINTLHDSWLAVLYPELTKPYFLNLKRFLEQEKKNKQTIFPPEKDIYSWSRLTPLNNVKVVILGQDPYHNFNQAHGLAFSVNPPTPPPPSLKNMYKTLAIDYPDFEIPKTGLLTPWAEQGVLMLNTVLTVRAHNANSHAKKGWEEFTEKALAAILKARPSGVCFLAWGTPAFKRLEKIKPDPKVHHILKSVHPSPLSASRGFFECQHFKKSNEWLYKTYGSEGVIDWAIQKGNVIAGIAKLKEAGKTEKENLNPVGEEGKKE